MATILKLGSLLLDGVHTNPGSGYRPGQTIDFGSGNALQWVVVNNLLIADRPLLVDISWDDLNEQNLVFGLRVDINGQAFLCRLLKVGTKKGIPNEWDASLDVSAGEVNLWNWKTALCWGQEHANPSNCALRGYTSVRTWYCYSSSVRNMFFGFRPVLEPLPSGDLVSGTRVCAIGGQSVLYGTLLEATDYDAIIQPEPASMMAEIDVGKCYSKLPNGTVILDRTSMIVQPIKEK